MKRGCCTFGDGKIRGLPVTIKGEGAVVPKSVPKLKESVRLLHCIHRFITISIHSFNQPYFLNVSETQ